MKPTGAFLFHLIPCFSTLEGLYIPSGLAAPLDPPGGAGGAEELEDGAGEKDIWATSGPAATLQPGPGQEAEDGRIINRTIFSISVCRRVTAQSCTVQTSFLLHDVCVS